MGKIKKRAGFTLIEVIVALGIFMIVVLALVSSYYSYYRNVQNERYKTIGENLAQLQLEDIQNLPVSVLSTIVGKNQTDGLGNYPYAADDTVNDPSTDNYIDKSDDPTKFDSGEIDSTFRIYRMSGGVTDLEDADIPGVGVEEFTADPSNPNVILYHNLYPGYKKQIVIQDLTPNENEDAKKIFQITVTVFWDNDQKSITVEGLKNDLSLQ
jgi:type II secretory pathway pseudopilin PulG